MAYRYSNQPNNGGEAQLYFRENQTLVYGANLKITPTDPRSEKINMNVALTGALTLTADVTIPQDGDKLTCLFSADAVSDRVVTFGTGFAANGTLTVLDAGIAIVEFVFFSGVWLEKCRFISAELS
jgi:hypothetical protein